MNIAVFEKKAGFVDIQSRFSKTIMCVLAISFPMYSYNQLTYWLYSSLGLLFLYSYPFLSGKGRLKKNEYALIINFFVFAIWIMITGALSGDLYIPLQSFVEIIYSVLFLMGIFFFVNSDGDYIVFLNAVILSGLFVSLYVFFSFGMSERIDFRILIVSKNVVSFYLFTSVVSVLIKDVLNISRWWDFLIFVFVSIMLFNTLSVKIIVSYLVVLFFYVIMNIGSKKYFLFILFLCGLIFFVMNNLAFERIFESEQFMVINSKIMSVLGFEPDYAFAEVNVFFRRYLMHAGMGIFWDNPVFGIGLENTRLHIGTYTHNNVVELLAGGGVLALILFYFPLSKVFFDSLQIKKFFLFSFSLIVSVILIGYADKLYDSYPFMIMMALVFYLKSYYRGALTR